MPKMNNQKYLMKIDLGGGNYRYLYTPQEVEAYKAGKTGGSQSPHGEKHYQYQTTDHTRTEGVTTGRQTNVRNNGGGIVRTTDRKRYRTSGQLIRGRRQIPDSGNASQLNYRYQTSRNGKTEVRTGTGAVERTTQGDRVANRKKSEQLKNAPQNHGGASSSGNYRYAKNEDSYRGYIYDMTGRKNKKGKPTRSLEYVVSGKNQNVYSGNNSKRAVSSKPIGENEYTPISKAAKRETAVENAKKAVKSAPAKAKAAGKSIAKKYDNATTKMADSALKATPKIKKAAKKVAKGYDNATTKMADSALKATPKIKKTAKNIAKNYDKATTKIADTAWNASHSKTAQKAKKTVSSGAKKASNALTKAWNNLFKKKKK